MFYERQKEWLLFAISLTFWAGEGFIFYFRFLFNGIQCTNNAGLHILPILPCSEIQKKNDNHEMKFWISTLQ